MYHGGKEHYRYPSPNLQKKCRKIVEKGADLVVCQHSHCVGSYEEIDGSTIIYGQGNFIFNTRNDEYWNTGLLVKMTITDGDFNIDFVPIVRTETGTRLANKIESEEILTKLYERSEEIQQEGFIEKKYNDMAQESLPGYLRQLYGFGKWKSRIDRKLLNGALLNKKLKKEHLLGIQNHVECESHRELFMKGVKNEVHEIKNR